MVVFKAMNQDKDTQILVAVEECIEHFIAERRLCIKGFVAEHFSLLETVTIQRKTFIVDLVSNPVNALWSIPYLTAKKTAEILDKLGWNGAMTALDHVPSAIKTGYQKKIEDLVASEFLLWKFGSPPVQDGLLGIMKQHQALSKVINSSEAAVFSMNQEFRGALDRYCASRALISDLSGTVLTFLVGWIYFGDKSMGLMSMGDRIARRMAKDKAAESFFLGKSIGKSYYDAFPPHATNKQVFLATVLVGALLTIVSLIATAMSDPLLKKMGLQERKLNALLDDLETTLLVQYKRKIRDHIKSGV